MCEKEAMYKEGSAACRNYSRLTMQVRTLSQQVLIAAVISLSVAILPEIGGEEPELNNYVGIVLILGGWILGCFSVSLALVDWHYQSAFTAIRNTLAIMEGDTDGPWKAHKEVRRKQYDFIASYFPFWILWAIGAIACIVGFQIFQDLNLTLAIVVTFIFVLELLLFYYIYLHQES